MKGPTTTIEAGAEVRVRDASGNWHAAVATSGVEPTWRNGRKLHDFPVVWVRIGDGEPVPWPVEDVERRDSESVGGSS